MIQSQRHPDSVQISPASFTAGSNVTANFDMLNADYATVRVLVSDIATPTVASASGATVSVLASDDTNASNFATVVANITGIKTAREVRYELSKAGMGFKRYGRLNLTAGAAGVSNDTVHFAAVVTLSRADSAPTNYSALAVTTTNDTVRVV